MTLTPPAVSGDLATAAFDYDLPDDRIAQIPLARRDASRLLHLAPGNAIDDCAFTDLPALLEPGDLLVANETRVRAARLHGTRNNGGHAELLVLGPLGDDFACLVRPARRLPEGTDVVVASDLRARVGGAAAGHPGARRVTFSGCDNPAEAIERHGSAPLPPYIHAPLGDASRYQTTYARGAPASAAAPTAGLHFTDNVQALLSERGVGWTTLRLDVGLGTFAPLRSDTIDAHVMHTETFVLPDVTAARVNATRANGGRIIAVGTTSLRVLESCARGDGGVSARSGSTDLYITPGHRITTVDGLLTNFHQPRSSLLVLLAALVGMSRWQEAYAHALREGYRFLSFGDAMLCWRAP